MENTARSATGQPWPSPVRAGMSSPDRTPARRPWVVRADSSTLDARTTFRKADGRPITTNERLMLAVLEGFCRSKPYCWPSNQRLAAAMGKGERTVQSVLREMELDGLIVR